MRSNCTVEMLQNISVQAVGIGVSVAFVVVNYLSSGDKCDLVHALLGLSLAILLTGIINDTIKICVGRSALYCMWSMHRD